MRLSLVTCMEAHKGVSQLWTQLDNVTGICSSACAAVWLCMEHPGTAAAWDPVTLSHTGHVAAHIGEKPLAAE